MAESKHTPGPWAFDGPPHNIIVWCGPDKRVAFIMTSDGPAEANARLIATAPELLDALRLHVAYEAMPRDRGGKNGPRGKAWAAFVSARDAAIARATGAA